MIYLSIFNPCSSNYNAFQDFKKLDLTKKIAVVAISLFAAVLSFGIAWVPIFRICTAKFSVKNDISVESSTFSIKDTSLLLKGNGCHVASAKVLPAPKHEVRTFQYRNGNIYEGWVLNGIPNGHGKLTVPNQFTYTGEWLNGKKHGQGIMECVEGISYTGAWENGLPHGQGTQTCKEFTYKGDWLNGKKHGHGEKRWANGDSFIGKWQNNKKHGLGQYHRKKGVLAGVWKSGKLISKSPQKL